MRRWLPLIVLGLIVLAFLAAGRDDDNGTSAGTGDRDEQLARAMCSDLADGLSLFQMHSQAVEHYRETGRSEDAAQYAAAQLEDLATREYCPEFRDAFEATIVYERWIAP